MTSPTAERVGVSPAELKRAWRAVQSGAFTDANVYDLARIDVRPPARYGGRRRPSGWCRLSAAARGAGRRRPRWRWLPQQPTGSG